METITQKPENIYDDNITEQYYKTVGENAGSGEHKTEADKYFESLIPQNFDNQVVLDHGCGNGRYGELFCQRGAKRVLGIDLSPSMIREATKRNKEQQLQQLEFVLGDINNLSVGKNKFDLVFSRFSLIYSPNISKVMKEIGESLKEGGEVLIETNVASIKNNKDEIQKNAIPLILRLGESEVPIKNFAITIDDYLSAFKEAGLKIQIEREYPASEITIDDSYKHKRLVDFKVFVFKLVKEKEDRK
jgi:ubiquinone/menaquinone biosynthesis C-methylase UbiE